MAQTNLIEQPNLSIQSKWQAIASHLQNQLKQEGVLVKVARKASNLYIILEFSGQDIPQQQPVVATLRQALEPLHQSGVTTIKIGAQQRGGKTPSWVEKIDLSSFVLAKELVQWAQADEITNSNWHSNSNIYRGEEKKYLRFMVGDRLTTLLALDNIREVVKISSQKVLAVPHTPDWLMGIYDWRGDLVWLTDLNRLLGFGRSSLAIGGMMISLQVQQRTLGLFIPQVEEIEQHAADRIQAPVPGLLPSHLLPYVQGYISATNSIVLEPSHLIRRTQQLRQQLSKP